MPHKANTDIRRLVTAQRNRLGDLVETLDDAAWNRLSLCAGWRVRNVVAHCTQSHVATPRRLATELITSGFSLTARNERWVAARGQHDRSRVLTEYRATADQLAVPAAEPPYALVEVVIHGYDIAWPVNRTVEVPTASLVTRSNERSRGAAVSGTTSAEECVATITRAEPGHDPAAVVDEACALATANRVDRRPRRRLIPRLVATR